MSGHSGKYTHHEATDFPKNTIEQDINPEVLSKNTGPIGDTIGPLSDNLEYVEGPGKKQLNNQMKP